MIIEDFLTCNIRTFVTKINYYEVNVEIIDQIYGTDQSWEGIGIKVENRSRERG